MSFTYTEKSAKMSTTQLTEEQKRRMEENRLKALERRKLSSNNLNSTDKIATLSSITTTAPMQPQSTNIIKPVESAAAPTTTTGYNGKCQLLADDPENRFEIIVGYNKGLIDLFKTLNGRKYDPDTKRWSFSLKSYDDIMMRIKHEFNNTIKLEPLDRNSNKKATLVKFLLINNQNFEAQVDYNQEILDIFKAMKTKKYDPNSKKWSFNLNEYEELVNVIRTKCAGSVNIVQLPKMVKEIFKDKLIINKSVEKQPTIDLDHLRFKNLICIANFFTKT